MAKFSEETLNGWRKPPSDTEEIKLYNAEQLVRSAIAEDPLLSKMRLSVFGQGSYANDTNVRLNSDIDINVQYLEAHYYDVPEGKTPLDFGIIGNHPYHFPNFKDAVQLALINHIGASDVTRNDKCITVEAASNRIETDVVPTFLYRRYFDDGTTWDGAKFKADSGKWIRNYPLAHIENGKRKNSETQKRFKRLTRIFRKIRYRMKDDGVLANDHITSFLMECLVWNIPNPILNERDTWSERLRDGLHHLWDKTREDETCKDWREVSDRLWLFVDRKWTRAEVNEFLFNMWHYLELS